MATFADKFSVGDRVCLTVEADRFPEGTVPAGKTGTVESIDDQHGQMGVRMDDNIGFDPSYDNVLYFYNDGVADQTGDLEKI